jgi:hypothetical protein
MTCLSTNWIAFLLATRRAFPQSYSRTATVLLDKIHACSLQYRRDCGKRFCITCVSAGFDIGNSVPVEITRFRQFPNCPV